MEEGWNGVVREDTLHEGAVVEVHLATVILVFDITTGNKCAASGVLMVNLELGIRGGLEVGKTNSKDCLRTRSQSPKEPDMDRMCM